MSETELIPKSVVSDQGGAASDHSSNAGSWREAGVLVVILLIGLFLRLQHLGGVNSWFDESLDWRLAQFSPVEIWERLGRDVHPPMYFLVTHGWGKLFGFSLISLRLQSVMWGELTIWGAYLMARRAMVTGDPISQISGKAFGPLLAALFVAISPLYVEWSQQIKMYSMGACLAVWSSWLLLTWFQTRQYSRLLLYIPIAAMLTLQHHYGVFTVFAQLIYGLGWAAYRWWKARDDLLLPTVLASWATTSLWSTWLPSFFVQRGLVLDSYWIRTFKWQPIVDVWAQLLSYSSHSQPSPVVAWITAEAAVIVIAILLLAKAPGTRLLGWLVFVPYAIAILWSFLLHNVFVPRFLIFANVFLLIGAAVLIGSIRYTWLRWTLTLLTLAGMSWAAHTRWCQRASEFDAPGMPVVVEILNQYRSKGEPVLVCNPMMFLNLLAHGPTLDRLYAFDPGYQFPHFQGTPGMKDSDYLNAQDLEKSDYQWVWTLDANEWLGGTWKVHLPPEWKLIEERSVREWYAVLVLRLYRRNSSPAIR